MSEKKNEGHVVNGGLHLPRPQVSVLVVDDDADFRALLRAYLPPEEFLVKEAADGGLALDQMQEYEFDLIVLDLVMPEREGLELIPAIRQWGGRSRILAVSGAPKRWLYLKTAGLMG